MIDGEFLKESLLTPSWQLSCTALTLAASKGHLKVVELLIEKGADMEPERTIYVSCCDDGEFFVNPCVFSWQGGWALLTLAILNGHPKLVELLIEKGADVEIRDNVSSG